MKAKRLGLMFLIVVLGIAVVGVANADIINHHQAGPAASFGMQMQMRGHHGQMLNAAGNVAGDETKITPERAQQLVEFCLQKNQTLVDQWARDTGQSREDLLKMGQEHMRDALQQNPDLSVQDAYRMHQDWMRGMMAGYQLDCPWGNENSGPGYGHRGGHCWR